MNTENNTPENEPPVAGGIPTDRRPLGYWLRVVDGLITREFQTAFAAEDVTRRDWMLLNILSGDIDVPDLADKLSRRGKRLRSLADRGWVAETDGRWELTDEGRAAHARLAGLVAGVREKVASAVSPEDFATMRTSLEAIARDLGWDESDRMPRGSRRGFGPRGRGFGPGFGGGFGPGFGPRHDMHPGMHPGFGGEHDDDAHCAHAHAHHHGYGHGHGHGHGHPHHDHRGGRRGGAPKSERAYERGFEAGFSAATRSGNAAPAASDSAA